jgi:hypothetical protein
MNEFRFLEGSCWSLGAFQLVVSWSVAFTCVAERLSGTLGAQLESGPAAVFGLLL